VYKYKYINKVLLIKFEEQIKILLLLNYITFREKYKSKKPSFRALILMAASTGDSGAFFGTPAEVALVRINSDGRLSLVKYYLDSYK